MDILTALINLLLAGLIHARGRRVSIRAFALFTFLMSLWHVCHFQVFPDYRDAFWMRVLFTTLTPLPVCGFLFARGYALGKDYFGRAAAALALLGAAFAFTVWTPLFDTRAWRLAFVFFSFPIHFAAVGLFWHGWKNERDGARRNCLLYLASGATIAVLGGFAEFLPHFGLPIPAFPFGSLSITVYTGLVAYAIGRYDLLSVSTLARRLGFFLSMATTVAAFGTGLLEASAQLPGSPRLNALLGLYALVPLLALAWERWGERIKEPFFAEERARDASLEAWLRESGAFFDERDLASRAETMLAETLDAEHCRLLLTPRRRLFSAADQPAPPWPAFFSAHRRGATRRGLALALERKKDPALEAMLRFADEHAAEALVPVFIHDEPAAVLALGPARGRFYDSSAMAWLGRASSLIGQALHNLRTREELLHSDRLAQVGSMAMGIAHEIRNPLGYLKTATSFVQRGDIGEDKRRQMLAKFEHEFDRINDLVEDILRFGKPKPPQKALVDLAELVDSLMDILRPNFSASLRIDWERPAAPIMAWVDPDQFKQVAINLVRNAEHALKDGERESALIKVSVASREGGAALEVSDNGPGIPADQLGKLFQPFSTGSAAGTGLGLAMVERLVRLNGGKIWVQSELGGGTSFTVELAAMDAPPAS